VSRCYDEIQCLILFSVCPNAVLVNTDKRVVRPEGQGDPPLPAPGLRCQKTPDSVGPRREGRIARALVSYPFGPVNAIFSAMRKLTRELEPWSDHHRDAASAHPGGRRPAARIAQPDHSALSAAHRTGRRGDPGRVSEWHQHLCLLKISKGKKSLAISLGGCAY